MPVFRPTIRTGRGALDNPPGRFEQQRTEVVDDGWEVEPLPTLATQVQVDPARSIISRNQSPDIPFEQSINPYRGCEHGCIYCYARPSHAYLGLSPGLDFETRLFYKADAARLLEKELDAPGYRCRPITLGANTDPYQPIERQYRVTRSLIEVLARRRHPFSIITKGALIDRDLDLLAPLAAQRLVQVMISIPTLDDGLKRKLEPRAASPQARLRSVARLHAAGVPVGVLVAPVIPVLTDAELERILQAAAEAGASTAGYVLLRLPHELKELFADWLAAHEPLKASHVWSRLQQMRGGRENDSRWGQRMSGQGVYAGLLAQRFVKACARLGLNPRPAFQHELSLFQPRGCQLSLL